LSAISCPNETVAKAHDVRDRTLWNEQSLLRLCSENGTMGLETETRSTMDDKRAKQLGDLLRTKRRQLGLSTRALSDLADVPDSTIVRIENGMFAAPAPDKLARIADALDIPLADVYAIAEYAAPKQLPTLQPYLRAKYGHMTDREVKNVTNYVTELLGRRGVDLNGPAPGEDEAPEAPRRTKTTKSTKKGGTK
jgi:transcriptional regulator with XRE-family HTH domain